MIISQDYIRKMMIALTSPDEQYVLQQYVRAASDLYDILGEEQLNILSYQEVIYLAVSDAELRNLLKEDPIITIMEN